MSLSGARKKVVSGSELQAEADHPLTVQPLAAGQEAEVLAYLASRPVHTVFMAGFVRDNGLESPLNRGTFYACRDRAGRLEGLALIGHATLVETDNEGALAAFARLTRDCPTARMILGEQQKAEDFWSYYRQGDQAPRLVSREQLLVQRWPLAVRPSVPEIRLATPEDLPLIVSINAQMMIEEFGTDPMVTDPVGFQQRCLRRIEQRRVWLWREKDRLVFKAEVLADTPEATYLAAVYVHPAERGKGYALRGLSQLGQSLLARSGAICLLVDEENRQAQALYQKAGFKLQGYYSAIHLQGQQ